ncbi:radical SAM/SPASM domain-containing protein [Desulfovibrio sp. SGI.169]|uniref:radical SAM protein n=1 Tax=Desulfovibrio sp. SGI.169 TaxID=3420561 RepID=UPI003CFF10C8
MPENDLLQNPAFRGPGLGERLRELFLGEKRPLDCVQVEVTSHCAGRCLYCPHTTQAKSWRSRHMSDEVFAALWPLLRRSSRAHLQGWGEPLLHPRFFDFVALARKAGCEVSSTSCGLRMDADLAARLVQSGMDTLAFSLVGTDAASNAARAGVPFERVCEAIRLIRSVQRKRGASGENTPEVHLAYLMLADRIEAAAALPRLMEELDVRMAVVSTLDYIAAPEQAALAFAPEETDRIARARAVLERAAAEAAAGGREIYYALPGPRAVADAGGCRENVTRGLYVDADGALSPCVYLNVPAGEGGPRRRIFGNALDGDAWELWNGEPFGAFRAALADNAPEACCLDCPKRFEV